MNYPLLEVYFEFENGENIIVDNVDQLDEFIAENGLRTMAIDSCHVSDCDLSEFRDIADKIEITPDNVQELFDAYALISTDEEEYAIFLAYNNDYPVGNVEDVVTACEVKYYDIYLHCDSMVEFAKSYCADMDNIPDGILPVIDWEKYIRYHGLDMEFTVCESKDLGDFVYRAG